MLKRILGRTNAEVTVVNIGGCGLGVIPQLEADKAMELALSYGINMIDVAPSYGEAELRLQSWMEHSRDKFFLAEKTMERTKEGAWKEMQESMKRLGVDQFDLYQFHAVPNMKELNQILGHSGALEAFEEAKESDMIKYIGITGHADIRVFIEALHRYEFDTVLLPVSITHEFNPQPENDFHPLLKLAREKNVGIQAIKSIMKRRWESDTKHTHSTWYEPLTEYNDIKNTLWYTLSQPGVTTCPMSCDVSLWPDILKAAENYTGMAPESAQLDLFKRTNKVQMGPLFPQ